MDPPNREHAATSVYRVSLRNYHVLFAAVHGLLLIRDGLLGRSDDVRLSAVDRKWLAQCQTDAIWTRNGPQAAHADCDAAFKCNEHWDLLTCRQLACEVIEWIGAASLHLWAPEWPFGR